MKAVLLIFCLLLSTKFLRAQMPILYYDFENNTTRSTFENLVEQGINTGNSTISKGGALTIGGANGAGLFYAGGAANGQAISSDSWSSTATNPGTAASTYFQFTVNTSGFSGLSVQFDCYVVNVNILGIGIVIGPRNAGILYSTDGGTTFSATSTSSTGTQNTWNHIKFDLSSVTAINDKSAVIIRVYGYNAQTLLGISEPMSIDNLQVNALSTVSNAGTKTMLNEANIYTSLTSGGTGSITSRQFFTITGTSTIVNMGQENFSGVATTAGSLTVQDTATLNITSSLTIDSAIAATSTPLSTLTINSYATVNLSSANLLCKGTTTVGSNGTFNCGTNTVTNTGTFAVSSGGNLGIGSTSGISSSGATGNIQTTTRSFNTSGNYIYNATGDQITGSALPASVSNLILSTPYNLSLTNNLTVNSQTSLGAGTLVIGSKTLTLNGVVSRSSGNFDGTQNSSLVLGGSAAQDIGFNANDTLGTLTINKSSGSIATLNSALNIFTGIAFNSANLGTLDLNNQHVTLKSNASFTAYVGRIYGNLNNATNVTIERYIPARRAWRLMGVPISSASAPTINAAWQEGGIVTAPWATVNPNPGYGTHITGGASSLGFDRNNVNNLSIRSYNPSTSKWSAVSNTNSTLITDYPAYMLFVRGSRAIALSMNQYAATDNTVLRMTGQLLTGAQTTTATTSGFKLVSNPYASTINFTNTVKTGMADTYYVWDPLLTGGNSVGALITLTRHGTGYIAAPTPLSPIDLSGSIESGAAFFVNFTGAGSLQINESDKTTGSVVVFRPASPLNNNEELLRVNLYSVEADSTISLLDGVVTGYSPSYSNDMDNMDAVKLTTAAENISMQRNGKSLAIEMRQPVGLSDTIFLQLSQLQQKIYRLEFMPGEFEQQPFLSAALKDNYLQTTRPINLNDTTTINFSVTADAASFSSGRFSVVFTNSVPILPVKFSSVIASLKSTNVAVQWTAENESTVSYYEIERSADGQHFSNIGIVTTAESAHGRYIWVDEAPATGNNYYKIKSVDISGKVSYSIVVQVILKINEINKIVYPNPVVTPVMQLHLRNEPAGEYTIRMTNPLGQTMFSGLLKHIAGSETEPMYLSSKVTKDVYQLEITKPDGSKIVTNCLVQ